MKQNKAIPCGLLEDATVTAAIKQGDLITSYNTTIRQEQWIAKLRQRQDDLLAQ